MVEYICAIHICSSNMANGIHIDSICGSLRYASKMVEYICGIHICYIPMLCICWNSIRNTLWNPHLLHMLCRYLVDQHLTCSNRCRFSFLCDPMNTKKNNKK
uniref:Uncharacterized protein n=1 Tax=Cacopsylla melanoneura TaxID=428564 RepID=A0A8D8ZID1_9HEMI